MRVESKASEKDQAPTLNRRLLDLRHIASRLKRSPMTPLQVCEAIIEQRLVDREVRTFFSGLPDDERHYWIASLYALLMPKAMPPTARSPKFHATSSRASCYRRPN